MVGPLLIDSRSIEATMDHGLSLVFVSKIGINCFQLYVFVIIRL